MIYNWAFCLCICTNKIIKPLQDHRVRTVFNLLCVSTYIMNFPLITVFYKIWILIQHCIQLSARIPNWEQLGSHRTFGRSGDIFGGHSWYWCYCHLLGRCQGCCSLSFNTQGSPTTKKDLAPGSVVSRLGNSELTWLPYD